jgi:diguanylate cyclase (GGDEF)-like protein
LPPDEFDRRHGTLLVLLWLTIPVLLLYSIATGGFTALHIGEHVAGLLVLAVISKHGPRRARSIACSLGLLTAAAVGVHISGGLTESHFSFFVVVMLLTVYEDWSVFLLAVGYVLVHHGVMGMVAPDEVFQGSMQSADPWWWAGIHAVFVGATGCAGLMTWRLNETVRLRMLAAQDELHTAATIDALTGLGNRRALMDTLDACIASGEPTIVAMFDLDGFKGYNDSFGHLAGDALLARLGARLQTTVHSYGAAFRLGGDEFCVVAAGDDVLRGLIERNATAALREDGSAFAITASCGTVLIDDASMTRVDALRLADDRMYANKNGARRSAGAQSKDVLLSALAERHPDLEHQFDRMAELAVEVAQAMGCSPAMTAAIGQAAELHDIGKVAIPAGILGKTTALDDVEWGFIRRHPIIGERIVSAAPALSGVAPLVRASHERWDGTGYPDGLSGQMIPLGARIIAACDALDAMVSERPYRSARSLDEARAELRRFAGTQFDPDVVDALLQALDVRDLRTQQRAAWPGPEADGAGGRDQADPVHSSDWSDDAARLVAAWIASDDGAARSNGRRN